MRLAIGTAMVVLLTATICIADEPGGVAPRPSEFTSIEALKALDCIEAWEQLCSPSVGPKGYMGPSVAVREDRVEVRPFDADSFVFRIVGRDGAELRLKLDSYSDPDLSLEGKGLGETAKLSMGKGGRGVFDGPDVYALLKGRVERKRIEIVVTEVYNRLHDVLVKRFVPGGKCEGLMDYQATGKKPCINKSSPSNGRQGRAQEESASCAGDGGLAKK